MKKLLVILALASLVFANENLEKSDSEYYCNVEYDKCMDACSSQDADNACVANCEDKFNQCIEEVLRKNSQEMMQETPPEMPQEATEEQPTQEKN